MAKGVEEAFQKRFKCECPLLAVSGELARRNIIDTDGLQGKANTFITTGASPPAALILSNFYYFYSTVH